MPQSSLYFTVLVLASMLATAAPDLTEAVPREITFTNKEGKGPADDLHLSFGTGTKVTDDGAFTGDHSTSSNTHNLFGATIKEGESATVKLDAGEHKVKIVQWWWTLGGTNNKNGATVGDRNFDDGSNNLSFLGTATGDGSVAVNINSTANIFTTVAGASAEESALSFLGFLEDIKDEEFALIDASLIGETTVESFGNLLGDPATELSVKILTVDSTQGFDLRPALIPVPAPSALLLLLAGLLVVLFGPIKPVRARQKP